MFVFTTAFPLANVYLESKTQPAYVQENSRFWYTVVHMTLQRKLLLGAGIILIAGGAIWYATTHTPQAGTSAAALPPSSYTASSTYYAIAANYATSTPLTGSANTAAVLTMRQFVSGQIAQFKTDGHFSQMTPQEAQKAGFTGGRKATLEIKYLIAPAPHTISYIYTTYEDTLGAHGNLFFKTFTFDTSTGKLLTLGDLFTPGSTYLDTLSQIARAKLPAVIGAQMVSPQMLDAGTKPEAKNFANFFINGGDLVILFPPYAVAPYAAGPQTLRIPLTSLKDLKSTYQQ